MLYEPIETLSDPAARRELERIAEVINALVAGRIPSLAVAPSKPFDGQFVIADGVNWDPVSTGVRTPVWYDEVAAAWKAV